MKRDTTQSVSKRRIMFISVMTRTVSTTRTAWTKSRTKMAARSVVTAMTTLELKKKLKIPKCNRAGGRRN